MRAKRQPRSVVAREHDERAPVQTGGLQRVEDAAGAGIDLLDDVSIHSGGAVTNERLRPGERNVRERVSDVQKKWPVPVVGDEPNGFLGVSPGQGAMVDGSFDFLPVSHQRHVPVFRPGVVVGGALQRILARCHHPHVVGVRQPVPIVKSLVHR